MMKLVYLLLGSVTGGLVGYSMINYFGAVGGLAVIPWDIGLGVMTGKAMRS